MEFSNLERRITSLTLSTQILDPLKRQSIVPLCASPSRVIVQISFPTGGTWDEEDGHTRRGGRDLGQKTAESPIIKGGKVNDDKGRTHARLLRDSFVTVESEV